VTVKTFLSHVTEDRTESISKPVYLQTRASIW